MNRSRRTTVALAALLATAVAGCSEGDDYCETLAAEQETLTELATTPADDGMDLITPTLESFERLRDDAPEELSDEFDTVVFAYRGLADAVDEAGISREGFDPKKPPGDLTKVEARRLGAVAGKLQSMPVLEAVAGIEDHADQVCDVQFTG